MSVGKEFLGGAWALRAFGQKGPPVGSVIFFQSTKRRELLSNRGYISSQTLGR